MKTQLVKLGIMRTLLVVTAILLGIFMPFNQSANALSVSTSLDYLGDYDRALFKHWIDADKNGCDTRAEVLISEAVVKPKAGKGCKITSGKWISPTMVRLLKNPLN
jgi:hypothetical protein